MGSALTRTLFYYLFQLERAGIQLIIFPALAYKLLVVAALYNYAVFKNHNRLAVADCG